MLLAAARDESTPEKFRVTSVMMQYYVVCKRELWFLSRDVEIDRDTVSVVRGTNVDDSAYGEKRRSMSIDGTIALDLLDDGRVVEVKSSSRLTEPARMQVDWQTLRAVQAVVVRCISSSSTTWKPSGPRKC